jgi:hypothetical protein
MHLRMALLTLSVTTCGCWTGAPAVRPFIGAVRPRGHAAMAERSDEDLDALRVPANAPARRRDGDWSLEESNRRQAGDPLGGGAADIEAIEQAQFRVQRRAAAGVYNSTSESRSLPLIALLAQVGLGGGLCAGLSYCWLLNAEAAKGTVWAIDALAHSDEVWDCGQSPAPRWRSHGRSSTRTRAVVLLVVWPAVGQAARRTAHAHLRGCQRRQRAALLAAALRPAGCGQSAEQRHGR